MIPTIIFFSVFVLPMAAFFIWLMRQDKRKGATGLIIVIVIVAGAIVYTYLTNEQAKKQKIERTGTIQPHVDTAK